jgi:hypothetical protein
MKNGSRAESNEDRDRPAIFFLALFNPSMQQAKDKGVNIFSLFHPLSRKGAA